MNLWRFGTGKIALTLGLALALSCALGTLFAAAPPLIVGDWNGAIAAGGSSLHIVVHVTQTADGKLAGTLDSPDQGASGIAMTTISFTVPDFHFEIQSIAGTYDGKLDKDNATIVGTWKQAGNELPLTLKRAAKP